MNFLAAPRLHLSRRRLPDLPGCPCHGTGQSTGVGRPPSHRSLFPPPSTPFVAWCATSYRSTLELQGLQGQPPHHTTLKRSAYLPASLVASPHPWRSPRCHGWYSSMRRDEARPQKNGRSQAEATVAVELHLIALSHIPNVDTSPSCSSPFAACLYGRRRTSRSLGNGVLRSWPGPAV